MGLIHDNSTSGAVLCGPDGSGNRSWRIEASVSCAATDEHIPVDLGDATSSTDRTKWFTVRDTAHQSGRTAWESEAASQWGSGWTAWYAALEPDRKDSMFEFFRFRGEHGMGL